MEARIGGGGKRRGEESAREQGAKCEEPNIIREHARLLRFRIVGGFVGKRACFIPVMILGLVSVGTVEFLLVVRQS